MLTNNYILIQTYFATNGYINDVGTETIPGTKDFTTGATYSFYKGSGYTSVLNRNASPRMELSICLGTGDTTPAYTDYVLDNDVSSSLNLSCSINTGADGGAIKTVFSVSGINATGSDITLKEFGILKDYMVSDSGYVKKPYLIARELLKTPKVISAGQPFTLTFEWSGS